MTGYYTDTQEADNILQLGISGGDILSNVYPEPIYPLPRIMSTGLAILAGRPKIGKSWLTMQMTQSKAAGGMLFNERVQPGRVLYIALEDNERRLQERMRQQNWSKKAAQNTTFYTAETFRTYVGSLHLPKAKTLELIIQDGGYKLVVIDTLSRAFMGLKDINDSQLVTAAISPLQELAMKLDIGLLFVDHHAKPKGNNPNPIDDIMGSTAKSAVLDTALGIYKDPQSKTVRLLAEGRQIAPVDITLKFDVVTGCWQNEGDTDKYVGKKLDKEIIDVLSNLGSASLSDICKAIGGKDRGNTSRRLTELALYGFVEKITNNSGATIAYKYIGDI